MALADLIPGLGIGAAILAGGLTRSWTRNRSSSAKLDGEGWRVLTPTAIVYPLSFVFPLAFVVLAWASVVDNEPLTGPQLAIAIFIFLFLGIAGAYSLWATFGCRVRWNGEQIRSSRWLFADRIWRLADARGITYSDNRGFCVTFADGTRLRFSNYENGASELAQDIRGRTIAA